MKSIAKLILQINTYRTSKRRGRRKFNKHPRESTLLEAILPVPLVKLTQLLGLQCEDYVIIKQG